MTFCGQSLMRASAKVILRDRQRCRLVPFRIAGDPVIDEIGSNRGASKLPYQSRSCRLGDIA
eukprot:13594224-Alexandrium_andersonii.AAC.1